MSNESTRCQFIDPISHIECEVWYQYEDGQKFCPNHRISGLSDKTKEVNHIPRTVTVISSEDIQKMNAKISECMKMSIPELVQHINDIDDQLRQLERDKRAANTAKRNLEEKLTDEERQILREQSTSYGRGPFEPKPKQPKKSPEEKAANRKEGFSAWAARLGLKSTEELMQMDDDEMAERVAKYKASLRKAQ